MLMFLPHNFIYVCFMRLYLSEIFCLPPLSRSVCVYFPFCLWYPLSILLCFQIHFIYVCHSIVYIQHEPRLRYISISIMLKVLWQADENEFWWLYTNVCKKKNRQRHRKFGQMNISGWHERNSKWAFICGLSLLCGQITSISSAKLHMFTSLWPNSLHHTPSPLSLSRRYKPLPSEQFANFQWPSVSPSLCLYSFVICVLVTANIFMWQECNYDAKM